MRTLFLSLLFTFVLLQIAIESFSVVGLFDRRPISPSLHVKQGENAQPVASLDDFGTLYGFDYDVDQPGFGLLSMPIDYLSLGGRLCYQALDEIEHNGKRLSILQSLLVNSEQLETLWMFPVHRILDELDSEGYSYAIHRCDVSNSTFKDFIRNNCNSLISLIDAHDIQPSINSSQAKLIERAVTCAILFGLDDIYARLCDKWGKFSAKIAVVSGIPDHVQWIDIRNYWKALPIILSEINFLAVARPGYQYSQPALYLNFAVVLDSTVENKKKDQVFQFFSLLQAGLWSDGYFSRFEIVDSAIHDASLSHTIRFLDKSNEFQLQPASSSNTFILCDWQDSTDETSRVVSTTIDQIVKAVQVILKEILHADNADILNVPNSVEEQELNAAPTGDDQELYAEPVPIPIPLEEEKKEEYSAERFINTRIAQSLELWMKTAELAYANRQSHGLKSGQIPTDTRRKVMGPLQRLYGFVMPSLDFSSIERFEMDSYMNAINDWDDFKQFSDKMVKVYKPTRTGYQKSSKIAERKVQMKEEVKAVIRQFIVPLRTSSGGPLTGLFAVQQANTGKKLQFLFTIFTTDEQTLATEEIEKFVKRKFMPGLKQYVNSKKDDLANDTAPRLIELLKLTGSLTAFQKATLAAVSWDYFSKQCAENNYSLPEKPAPTCWEACNALIHNPINGQLITLEDLEKDDT
jgi:hypothetical protein